MRKIIKIVGKPGTGKTTYLANDCLKKFESGILPSEILFTSFSRSAMKAMYEKFDDYGLDRKQLTNFGTIYSLANRTLGYNEENYIQLEDFKTFCDVQSIEFDASAKTIRKIEDINEFGVTGDNTVDIEGNVLFDWWQQLKRVFITNEQARKMMRAYSNLSERGQEAIHKRDIEQLLFLFDEWEKYKVNKNKFEYDDLLQSCLINNRIYVRPFRYACIDESHDFGPLQMKLFDFWCSQPYVLEEIICFDKLQTIYTFNGADPSIIEDIVPTEPIIILPKSYRVPQIPWEFAKNIAKSLNDSSMDKIQASDNEGDVLFCSRQKAVSDILLDRKKTFFLFRKNRGTDSVKEFLVFCRDNRIPINGIGRTKTIFQGKYFTDIYNLLIKLSLDNIPSREEVRSLLMSLPASYLKRGYKQDFDKRRFVYWGSDTPSKEKLFDDKLSLFYGIFKEHVGNVSDIKDIISYPNFKLDRIKKEYLLSTTSKDIPTNSVNIYTGTYHSSKGLEADNVVLQDYHLEEGWSSSEESRVGYVGITRTKNNLYVLPDFKGEDFLASFY